MKNKDLLYDALELCDGSLESFINIYLSRNASSFDAVRVYELIKVIEPFLQYRLEKQKEVIRFAQSSAMMLETFLKGKMYNSKEATIDHMDLQAMNAEKLKDKLGEVFL